MERSGRKRIRRDRIPGLLWTVIVLSQRQCGFQLRVEWTKCTDWAEAGSERISNIGNRNRKGRDSKVEVPLSRKADAFVCNRMKRL